jgi:hypothetical protein
MLKLPCYFVHAPVGWPSELALVGRSWSGFPLCLGTWLSMNELELSRLGAVFHVPCLPSGQRSLVSRWWKVRRKEVKMFRVSGHVSSEFPYHPSAAFCWLEQVIETTPKWLGKKLYFSV